MKFDVIVGNPPYTSCGTRFNMSVGYNSKLYQKFTKYNLRLLTYDGLMVYVTPKNIIFDFGKAKNYKEYDMVDIDMMEDTNHWQYSTCHYMIKKGNNTIQFKKNLYNKIFNYKDKWLTFRYIGAKINHTYTNCPKITGDRFHNTTKMKVTTDSFTVKNEFFIQFETLEEADAFLLFLKENLIIKFLSKKLQFVPLVFYAYRVLTKFNPLLLNKPTDYPVEWNLTDDEIKYIEDSING